MGSKNFVDFTFNLFRLRYEWRELLRPIIKSHKVSLEEWLILISLEKAKEGHLTVTVLANKQATKISNVSRYTGDLVKRGLMSRKRNPKNDREVLVSISNQGRKLLKSISVDLKNHEKHLTEEMNKAKLRL